MEKCPIPVQTQAEALVTGQIYQLLSTCYGTAVYDPRPYVTATRRDLEDYLRAHPTVAHDVFAQQYASLNRDDVQRVEHDGDGYVVFSLYRGQRDEYRRFDTLEEATAEFTLRRYGFKLD
jgi:hypothetical protein